MSGAVEGQDKTLPVGDLPGPSSATVITTRASNIVEPISSHQQRILCIINKSLGES
jgi:hypothetical protein